MSIIHHLMCRMKDNNATLFNPTNAGVNHNLLLLDFQYIYHAGKKLMHDEFTFMFILIP